MMRKYAKPLLTCLLTVQFTGCSVFPLASITPNKLVDAGNSLLPSAPTANNSNSGKVNNPPARTLRFDGHEIVLGESENQALDVDKLRSRLNSLVTERKFQSAKSMVLIHRESAERLLLENWATDADDPVLQLCALALSQRSNNADSNWQSLLTRGRANSAAAMQFQSLRNAFAGELQTKDPSNASAEQLLQAAVKVNHPLVRIDAFRLLGLRELVAGRHSWAEAQFRQAIEVALASGHPMTASELWLTVAESARRNNQSDLAIKAWSNSINLQLTASPQEIPLDVSFWLLAEKTQPDTVKWPEELSRFFGSNLQQLGCSHASGSEMALWGAIGQSQFERGELQAALVNFKKAETLAHGENVMWLRIAQAKCLAGMGQAPSAAAILSGPAASQDTKIAATAMATMGSIKLQSGAYQQGAQLLSKALNEVSNPSWPNRNQCQADLAIAQLIFGDTETGLTALHEAQKLLEQSGERGALVQSLENELRLLSHEQRSDECLAIRNRIITLEKL